MPTTRGSPPASPRSCSTSRRSPRSTCAAARRARARPTCSSRTATVERIDAIVLSGGSAFGLDAAVRRAGLAARAGPRLCGRRRRACRSCRARSCSTCSTAATRTGAAFRPIAISATRRRQPPAPTSRSAPRAPASAPPPSTSRAGSARPRRVTRDGHTVGALVAVNACGSVTVGDGPHFWAAPFERDGEFGGRGFPATVPPDALRSARQGPAGREHHDRGGRDRRDADQGAGQAARGDGAGRARARDLSGAHRRSTATWCSRPRPAAGRSPIRSRARRARRGRRQRAGPRGGPRRVSRRRRSLPGGICRAGAIATAGDFRTDRPGPLVDFAPN